MDWLMRPWARGRCSYEAMLDGTLGLLDIALMNDAMDVFDENERRASAARARSE